MLVYRVLPKLPAGIIWEAAAGSSHLVGPLRKAGREVVATDLYPDRADIERLDFLHGQISRRHPSTRPSCRPPRLSRPLQSFRRPHARRNRAREELGGPGALICRTSWLKNRAPP
jgi:hypothetical protein